MNRYRTRKVGTGCPRHLSIEVNGRQILNGLEVQIGHDAQSQREFYLGREGISPDLFAAHPFEVDVGEALMHQELNASPRPSPAT